MAAGFSSKWLAASILLAVFSLGLSGILKLLTSVLLIICGCLVVLYAVTSSDRGVAFASNVLNARQRWQRQQRAPQAPRGRPSMSSQLTGIQMMDDQLHLIISYLMRDYVHSWQGQLTHTNDLPQHAQQTLQHVVSSLADKFARVDWIPFLTTR